MGNVLQQPTTIERHVITREGELDVTITLNLNITLNSTGEARIGDEVEKPIKKSEKQTEFEIPDFETPKELLDFN